MTIIHYLLAATILNILIILYAIFIMRKHSKERSYYNMIRYIAATSVIRIGIIIAIINIIVLTTCLIFKI